MSKISIIMPAYNAEVTIERAINSVMKQTFKDFELLIVNDGSTDQTLEIIESITLDNDRVKVINIRNSGVSVARNTGLKLASSKYITFLDSDDYYVQNALEKMMINIHDNVQLLVFGYHVVDSQDCILKDSTVEKCQYFSEKSFRSNAIKLIQSELLNAPWNKVYRKDIIDRFNICFPENIDIAEDLIFNLEYIKDLEKVNIIDEKLVRYVVVENQGLVSKFRENRLTIRLTVYHKLAELYNYWNAYDEAVQNSLREILIKDVMAYFMDFYKVKCPYDNQERINIAKETLKIDEVVDAINNGRNKGVVIKVIQWVLVTNNVRLILMAAKLLHGRRKH